MAKKKKRSKEYMKMRQESDKVHSVWDPGGVPVIMLGKIVDGRIRSEIRAIKDKGLMIARIRELRRQVQADFLKPEAQHNVSEGRSDPTSKMF